MTARESPSDGRTRVGSLALVAAIVGLVVLAIGVVRAHPAASPDPPLLILVGISATLLALVSGIASRRTRRGLVALVLAGVELVVYVFSA